MELVVWLSEVGISGGSLASLLLGDCWWQVNASFNGFVPCSSAAKIESTILPGPGTSSASHRVWDRVQLIPKDQKPIQGLRLQASGNLRARALPVFRASP